MSTYKDSRYDVTVECDRCHDMFDCEIQLFSVREIVLVKELVNKLMTECQNCGEYFTAEEIKQLQVNKKSNASFPTSEQEHSLYFNNDPAVITWSPFVRLI